MKKPYIEVTVYYAAGYKARTKISLFVGHIQSVMNTSGDQTYKTTIRMLDNIIHAEESYDTVMRMIDEALGCKSSKKSLNS